ncbi:hypothetical protein KUCAC02_008973 [Chaenocephalus aceratus]|uniref:Uncharacterized protein n=1 Tax=Chaenocephalus aceratus TaxID=36190 RepID=A0ACB9WS48_CHAAC|nr:hypothetical protein KUCAC02_008973 [Chaenocephalus aceratus]
MSILETLETQIFCAVKSEEEEREVTPPGGRHMCDNTITNQFASLMEARTRAAVEKILTLLKVSLCEAAEQRAERKDEKKQKNTRSGKQGKWLHPKSQIQTHMRVTLGPRLNLEQPQSWRARGNRARGNRAGDNGARRRAGRYRPFNYQTHKKSTGPFKCPSCDKQFRLKCWMDRHYLTHSKPHLCSECGKGFVDQRMLIAHSRKHTGEKPYECSDCGTKFAYKSTFKRHMLNHSLKEHSLKETNFHTCSLCEKQFEGLVTFQRHRCCALKKTFNCSLCLETFTCSQSLVDHEQLHPGARYYVCEVCGERFLLHLVSGHTPGDSCGKEKMLRGARPRNQRPERPEESPEQNTPEKSSSPARCAVKAAVTSAP